MVTLVSEAQALRFLSAILGRLQELGYLVAGVASLDDDHRLVVLDGVDDLALQKNGF